MTDQTASAGRGGFSMHRVIERIGIHNISLLVALVGLLVIFGVLRGDVFFSTRNLLNIGMGVAILGVLAISQTGVIVSGGLDISVGSIVGLTTVATAMAIQATDMAGAGLLARAAPGVLSPLLTYSSYLLLCYFLHTSYFPLFTSFFLLLTSYSLLLTS